MKLYFAPLEGLGGYRYRQLHHEFFPGVDKYFAPFVVPKQDGILRKRELQDILPENNEGLNLVPQILTNHAGGFLKTAVLFSELGYKEVNLNLGCPSGTVTKKGRGAGFIQKEYRGILECFLNQIFDKTPVPISVKTRIGWENPDEFAELLDMLNRYPMTELIVHPRTRQEFYEGSVHRESFAYAYEHSKLPLCYNGDVRTVEDYQSIMGEFPHANAVMIGRGLIANPGLVSMLKGKSLSKEELRRFHDALTAVYVQWLQGDIQVLHKLKEIWCHMAASFTEREKYLKLIMKARRLEEYQTAVNRLFAEQELCVK